MKILRLAFIAAALAVLALPCLLIPVAPSGIGAENRLPAAWPQLIAEGGLNLGFPAQFEAWLQDHVALRGLWIGLYSRALRALGTSREEQVILGRDGWLFFRETLGDYTGAADLDDNAIARMALLLDTADRGLRASGSRLLLAVVPNKATVYPERMSAAYPHREGAGNAQRLEAAAHVRRVPLTERLRSRAGEGLYFPGDTHWNARGARYGARAILEALADETGVDIPLPDPDAECEILADWPSDLMRLLDPYTDGCDAQQHYSGRLPFSYQGRYRTPEDLTIQTAGGAAPLKLTVLRDSFTNLMLEDISGAVGGVTYLRAMPLPLSAGTDSDAVVLEIVERRLPELLDAPPDLPAPLAEAPEALAQAEIAALDLRAEQTRSGPRLFGALAAAPDGLAELKLGVRTPAGETWYDAFPVSGDPEDGDRGFSALLEALPEGAEVCLYLCGDIALRSEWTPVPAT